MTIKILYSSISVIPKNLDFKMELKNSMFWIQVI